MLGWDIRDNDHEAPQGVEYFGSGFQRHFIYSLIQLGAKYVPQRASKKAKDFAPSLNLVLFEEPEAFLHPPQQEDLARSLVKVSEATDWQIICSTHSAHFVSRNAMRIPAIIRARRAAGVVSIFQIDDARWNSIVDSNHAIQQVSAKYPKVKKTMEADDQKPEMESVKYFLWLNPDRAGMLFAQNVLLVEGPSETALITRLLDDGDNNANEHQELNQLVADSKSADFTHSVTTIPKDLEDYLGVVSAGSPHRKPQHLLYYYATNRIDNAKLTAFCELVRSCFATKEDTP
jgi:hypothetical protein